MALTESDADNPWNCGAPCQNHAGEIPACPLKAPSPDLLAATQMFAPPGADETKAVIVCLEDDQRASDKH